MTHDQQHQHQQADVAELQMTPLELLKHRLSRQTTTLINLQAIVQNTIPALMKDISFCMQVIEAIETHLPANQQDGHAAAAAAPAAPGAFAPTLHEFDAGGRPGMPDLPPVRFDTPASAAPTIANAAAGAQAALGRVSEAVSQRPTPQRAAAAPTRATAPRVAPADQPVAQDPNQRAQQAAAEYTGHFYGSGSVIAKFLSPSVYSLGRGFLEPGYGGLEQYTEDVLKLRPVDLETNQWPSGFYRDSETKLQQLLMRNNKVQVVVSGLPNADTLVQVSFAPFNERVEVKTLSIDQMGLVWSFLHAAFLAVDRAANNAQPR